MDLVPVTAMASSRQDSDSQLVTACLRGDEAAWAGLIAKYKRLIYSIPVKRGFARDEAADVFQAVCLLLVSELPRLRDPNALPGWIITTTSRECARVRRVEARHTDLEEEAEPSSPSETEQQLFELQKEQAIREAVASLPPRCRTLIEMLFFRMPPVPYKDVAGRLGIATGSIGFIRGRCLTRLRGALKHAGL